MPLQPGTTLGPYRVTAKIGEGGMGEVYRARDTKLDRDVALKVLPQAFTDDPDRLARFEREAKVLASLNHPNIGHIYGLEEAEGQKALVLELVEGPTLAERIKQGPIPVDEALTIAKQIAEALEAAHEQGIIHRDLKPANIKVKDDGTVKVLDFGLAKAFQPEASDVSASMSPTISLTAAATQMGMVIGTAAYMAPEQAKGLPVDKRADIWAYGAVLFEMLTGRKLFDAGDVSEMLASVLVKDPDVSSIGDHVPAHVRSVVRQCLVKDPKERLRDIGDVRLAMKGVFGTTVSTSAEPVAVPHQLHVWQRSIPAAIAALAIAAIASLAVWTLKPSPPLEPLAVSRLVVSVPPSAPVSINSPSDEVTISADGTTVVYRSGGELHVRSLDELEGAPLRGAAGANNPFLSPNGAWVAFEVGNTLQKVSIQGGPAVTVCELPGRLAGASWGDDDVIVFGVIGSAGLFRVPGAGGEPEVLTETERGAAGRETAGISHRWPDVLPGSRGVLFTSTTFSGVAPQIRVLNVDTGEQAVIIPNGTHPRYSPTGHIVYGFEGTLRAVAFDVESLTVLSDPVPVVEGVLTKGSGSASFGFSDTGSLVYVSGVAGATGATSSFVWVDREGGEESLPLPARGYSQPRLSPDGRRVAVRVNDQGQQALWVYDVATGAGLRLTHEGDTNTPVWTPDSERVVFAWNAAGHVDLYWVPADGSEAVESLLADNEVLIGDFATAVTPDGSTLLFSRVFGQGRNEVWALPLDGERTPTPVLEGPFSRGNAETTPDGEWLAYRSSESGEEQIYLQPYPGPGSRVPVSIGGGRGLLMSPSGSELFYRLGTAVMAVDLNIDGDGVRTGAPRELFDGDYVAATGGGVREYHVGPDGRFLMQRRGDQQDGEDQTLTQVILVQNWFEELQRLLPVP